MSAPLSRLHALALIATLTFAPLSSATAQEAPPAEEVERVRIRENFSPFELATVGVSTAGAVVLIGAGDAIFGSPIPSLGVPDPGSVDWRFTHWANERPDPLKKWLGGAPDTAGYVMPFAALGFYTAGSIGSAFYDDFLITPKNHEIIAFVEAFAWTMFSTNILKLTVGRARPFTVRTDVVRDDFGEDEKEFFLSFPSGHSASAASTTTFLALDLSDHLVHHTFKDTHPALRYGLGYGLPFLGAVSLSGTVMFSRIRDQKHWLSDTLVGAMIGSSFSALFYRMHFDKKGNPRRRHELGEEEASSFIKESYMAPSTTASGPMLQYGFIF